jgi:hypothetical protein
VPKLTQIPCEDAELTVSVGRARLKIVVSPVRVRISPSGKRRPEPSRLSRRRCHGRLKVDPFAGRKLTPSLLLRGCRVGVSRPGPGPGGSEISVCGSAGAFALKSRRLSRTTWVWAPTVVSRSRCLSTMSTAKQFGEEFQDKIGLIPLPIGLVAAEPAVLSEAPPAVLRSGRRGRGTGPDLHRRDLPRQRR